MTLSYCNFTSLTSPMATDSKWLQTWAWSQDCSISLWLWNPWCDYQATLCWLAEDPIGAAWRSPTKCYPNFVGDCTWSTRITVQEQMGIPIYAWIKLRAAVQCRIQGLMSVSICVGIWLRRVNNLGHPAYAVHQSVLSSITQQCTAQWGYRVNTE